MPQRIQYHRYRAGGPMAPRSSPAQAAGAIPLPCSGMTVRQRSGSLMRMRAPVPNSSPTGSNRCEAKTSPVCIVSMSAATRICS
jgi:hypothetical protein